LRNIGKDSKRCREDILAPDILAHENLLDSYDTS
jgi:hypothetical protein